MELLPSGARTEGTGFTGKMLCMLAAEAAIVQLLAAKAWG